jgi:CheY-like chemotaxis protein
MSELILDYEKKRLIFQERIQNKRILICDSSSASRRRLAKMLVDLGSKMPFISIHEKYSTALDELPKFNPDIIIADFDLIGGSGFDLIQAQRATLKTTKDHFFVIVTANSTQSAIAQAAEEDIDAYILKPYTIQSFNESLLDAWFSKFNPSPYIIEINEGKELLFSGKLEESILVFKKAKELHPKPALALFYAGQAEQARQSFGDALKNYKQGLTINKLHFKCLIAQFELLMSQKEYTAAYEVVTRIAKFFPANPKRLASVLRLAIQTEHFQDIESYYLTFTQLETRSDELLRYMCAGLLVTARHYFREKTFPRANDLVLRAAVSSAHLQAYLVKGVELLSEYRQKNEAHEIANRIQLGTPHYEIGKFLVSSISDAPNRVFHNGKQLLSKGIEWPSVYALSIAKALECGERDEAEAIFRNAVKKFPSDAKTFETAAQSGVEVKKNGG